MFNFKSNAQFTFSGQISNINKSDKFTSFRVDINDKLFVKVVYFGKNTEEIKDGAKLLLSGTPAIAKDENGSQTMTVVCSGALVPARPGFNQIVISGRIAREIESKLAGEKQIAQYSIPVSEKKKDGDTTWFNITSWEKDAESLIKWGRKGHPVMVVGYVRAEMDKEGVKSYYKVTSNEVTLMNSKAEDEQQPTTSNSFDNSNSFSTSDSFGTPDSSLGNTSSSFDEIPF